MAYYPRRLHPFSGALEPGSDEPDIFDQYRRELREELGLAIDAIDSMALLGIVEDPEIRHPELILHVKSTWPADRILAGLDAAEHTDAHAVATTLRGLEAAMALADFTPVARAVLCLWREQG